MIARRDMLIPIMVLVILLPIGNMGINTSKEIADRGSTFTPSQYIVHDPINIESDTDFVEQGWPGNGTEENPYLIQELSIISNSSESCIIITNTRMHVLLTNCRLQTESEFDYSYGVFLANTTNIIIERCEINYENRGIYVEESSSIEIRMNVMVPISIESSGNGILLARSFDCKILANRVGAYSHSPSYWRDGIIVEESDNCSISHNRIIGHGRHGSSVTIKQSNYSKITDNKILSCNYGIYLSHSHHSQITKNTIYLASNDGITLWTSSNSSIYSNYIGWNELNAQDNGISNQWDDGISEGNYWSDYSGEGIYAIDGSASSVDHFPSIWDEDVFGPEFQYPYFPNLNTATITMATGYTWGYMDSYLISINVTDTTGVDCVQMVRKASLSNGDYEWLNYTMTHDPLLDNPNRYTYNVSFQEHGSLLNFYIMANDTLGNWNATTDLWLGDQIFVKITSDSTDESGSLINEITNLFLFPNIITGICCGIIIVVILQWYRKSR